MAASPTAAAGAGVAVRVRGLEVAYGRIRAVQGVSLDVREGAITALVGANGAGKSTLLKAIAGLVAVRSGAVEIPAGSDVTGRAPHVRVRELGVALIPEGRGVFGGMTVDENLALGVRVGRERASGDGAPRTSRDDIFALFPVLGQRRDMQARYLSGGEQQMLTIARALLMEPRVLLVDEPSMGLAPLVVRSIFDTLRGVLAERRISVLLVEQDSKLALRIADHAYVIERGRIHMQGTAEEVRRDPRLHAAYLGAAPPAADPAAQVNDTREPSRGG